MTFKTIPLQAVAKISSGDGAPQSDLDFAESGVPFVRAGSLPKLLGGESEADLEHLRDDAIRSRGMRIYSTGTILFAKSGMSCTKGHVYRLRQPSAVVNHLAAVECGPSIAPSFLVHWLRANPPTNLIENAAYPSIKISAIRSIAVPVPPLPEQKRIAAILDSADALRDKRRESIRQLDALIQSTFIEMFGDPVKNPMGWEIAELQNVSDVRDGTHDSPKYVDDGYPLLTSKNFKDGRISIENASLISREAFEQINRRSKVDVGDLVMPMIGTVGNPVLIRDEPMFAIKNVALIKRIENGADAQFLQTLLSSHYFDHVTRKSNRGGTQKFVALKDLRTMPIYVPPRAMQESFGTSVAAITALKEKLVQHLAALDALFFSLQTRAFAGEI